MADHSSKEARVKGGMGGEKDHIAAVIAGGGMGQGLEEYGLWVEESSQ